MQPNKALHSTFLSEAAKNESERRRLLGDEMNRDKPSSDELQKHLSWFESYASMKNTVEPRKTGMKYHCPCCGYKTLPERGGFEICPVCFWEDDGQDDHDADVVRAGPNYSLSLTKARENFKHFGACERKHMIHVRQPQEDEKQ